MSTADVEQFESVLAESGVDLSALAYLKANKATSNTASTAASSSSSASSVARGLFDNLLDRGAGLFAGIKNILPVSKDFTMTKIVDALLNHKAIPEVENYLYFDPKVAKKCMFCVSAIRNKSAVFILFIFLYTFFRSYRCSQSAAKAGSFIL
jgi:hypothetical protein